MIAKEFITDLLDFISVSNPNKDALISEKKSLAKKHGLNHIPSDIQILTHLDDAQLSEFKEHLLTKPMRTNSGVTVVAVMTKPLRCPHGKCTYCPGGPGSAYGDVPQSYTGHEPATMRGIRAGYDAYLQVFGRLEQYIVSGHNPEKVELILMGGTLPSYDVEYQDEVIRDVFKAMNDFSTEFYTDGVLQFEKFKEFFELPGEVGNVEREQRLHEKMRTLKAREYDAPITDFQHTNETAKIRCIGLTIETRPSHAGGKCALRMLEQGCTRVELGIQTTFDEVLTKVHRDHSVQDSIAAIADLRDLGFKLNFHVMLGLPLMNEERDREAVNRIFSDPDFKPDMVKIYPCMVMRGTPLYYEYEQGLYKPYSTEQAAHFIAQTLPTLPPWVRIMRVQRDIPTKMTHAGVDKTNLRQYVDKETTKGHFEVSQDISAREIRDREIKDWEISVIEYDASNGKEFFIQAVEKNNKGLIGFCRLRFPGRQLHPEITPSTAIIRELHVYGQATGLGLKGKQHKGFGSQLVEKAEAIAREHNKDKMLVISGVGVRQYYINKHGYTHAGPYVGKKLS